MKKTWTKESFIEETRKQMANICDPKRQAAMRCRKNSRRYTLRKIKEQMKKRGPRNV